MKRQRKRLSVDRVFVMTCSLVIAIMITGIIGMLLAAFAFSTGTSITIPLTATFNGVRDVSDSPMVAISASWVGTAIVTMIFALPLWVVTLRYGEVGNDHRQRSGN